MDLWTMTITAACIVMGFLIWQQRSLWVGRKLPPGPYGLPFFGKLFGMSANPPVQLKLWSEIYGKIISVRLGRNLFVAVHDFEVAKSILHKDVITGRDALDVMNVLHEGQGLVMGEGDRYREHRRFALTALRDVGMGKSWLEQSVLAEVSDLIALIDRSGAKPLNLRPHMTQSVSNMICALVFGKRFSLGDATFNKLCNNVGINLQLMSEVQPVRALPFLKYVPFGKLAQKWRTLKANIQSNRTFIESLIDDHKQGHATGHNGGTSNMDYIHRFLDERAAQLAEKGETTFDDEQLYYSVVGLFGGGTETTTTTVLWALIYMVLHPNIKKRVQDEIDAVVTANQQVRLEHRGLLRYTEATILEVQRLASAFPLNGARRTNFEDMEIGGFHVPARSIIVVNTYAIHRDPKYWPDPLQFNPERFLDPVTGNVKNPPGFLPFGIGKRSCIGEPLAKMEVYIFFANIMKDFDFQPVGAFNVDPENFSKASTVIRAPLNFELQFARRTVVA
ncbi:Cytochrome P450 2U1 [Hypsibius exemplaris]|uniref:Cytochrome P450 2U1 n=1 Tax=Hypsibius exemplaris TaxID=2072580 RepID=A0A1W0WIG7_HYPEX|nr:Cytochrome P450 2U1 [Hypsibius exemplaris]